MIDICIVLIQCHHFVSLLMRPSENFGKSTIDTYGKYFRETFPPSVIDLSSYKLMFV